MCRFSRGVLSPGERDRRERENRLRALRARERQRRRHTLGSAPLLQDLDGGQAHAGYFGGGYEQPPPLQVRGSGAECEGFELRASGSGVSTVSGRALERGCYEAIGKDYTSRRLEKTICSPSQGWWLGLRVERTKDGGPHGQPPSFEHFGGRAALGCAP